MKRMYETEWQGIKFSDFAKLSTTDLADAKFYNAFYRELFRRYKGYEDIDISWRRHKQGVADWIAKRTFPGSRVLSVGCVRIPTQVATRFRFIPPPDSDLSRHRIPKHFATPWEVRKGRWINLMKAAKAP